MTRAPGSSSHASMPRFAVRAAPRAVRAVRAVVRGGACAVLAGAALLAAGCGGPVTTALREVTVVAKPAANNGSATSLDLVFVYDATSAATLPRTGPDWFASKSRLEIALGPKIEVASVELPAAQSFSPVPLPTRHKKALVVYCYVNFTAPAGQGVADLTPFKRVRITLSPDTVTYKGDQ
jgi:hypothetical protein